MKFLLILLMVWAPSSSFAWEVAEQINVTPWIGSAPAQAQFRRAILDFGPGAPMGDARLKGAGLFNAYGIDDCGSLGNALLKRLSNLDQYILYARTSKGTPLYFADKLFYLISIDPPAIAIVPHKFPFKHQPDRVSGRNDYFTNELMDEYIKLSAESQRVRLRAYGAHMPEWTNGIELSAVVPSGDGIEVISDRWPHEVPLAQANADLQWPFIAIESSRYPGHLEFVPRGRQDSAAPRAP